MNLDASGLHLLARSTDRVTDLDWSPDGQRSPHVQLRLRYLEHVVISKVGGPGFRALIGPRMADIQTPMSPRLVARCLDRVLRSADAGERWGRVRRRGWPIPVARQTWCNSFRSRGRPSWSPDRSRIAFERDGSVWTMKADGSDQVNLATGGQPVGGRRTDRPPLCHPDRFNGPRTRLSRGLLLRSAFLSSWLVDSRGVVAPVTASLTGGNEADSTTLVLPSG
jgi:hypothetical protein